jgi:hypothetical protein
MTDIKRKLLLVAGTVFVVLGVIGIFLPLMPTTVFLLLAAACYMRSSEKFYRWLINHRILGGMIRDYREGRGIPLRNRLITTLLLWATIGASGYFFVENDWVRLLLGVIAVGVSAHLLTIHAKKTVKEENGVLAETD